MSSFYDSVGEEPTYELAENIIKAIVHNLKHPIYYLNCFPNSAGYLEYSLERLEHKRITRFTVNKSEIHSAVQIIINHFPDLIKKSDNTLLIKDSAKQLLNANDLLIMDYYYLLLSEYEERVNKYQRYLNKQQDKQRNKLLLVLLVPFITVIYILLVGD